MCHTDDIIERQIEEGLLGAELRDRIAFVLLRRHRHQTKKPIHRSLADIGKTSSTGEPPVTAAPTGSHWVGRYLCTVLHDHSAF